jgi:hypothetical protein
MNTYEIVTERIIQFAGAWGDTVAPTVGRDQIAV